MREGNRKGVPNNACPNQTGQYNMTGNVPKEWTKTLKKRIIFRAWNVYTHIGSENTLRPEKRTSFTGRELTCYNIEIAALSEMRLPGEGSICKPKGGYTIFLKRNQRE